MNGFFLYGRYASLSLRSQMQYRASFLFMMGAYCIQTATEFFSLWMLMDRFQGIAGWTMVEVALLYGITNCCMALAEFFGRAFDQFSALLKSGDFDILLLRPRSTALQVAGQELQPMRLGRFVQGFLILIWAISSLSTSWNLASTVLLFLVMISGTCLFCSLFIIQAALAFWTTETLEIMNILTFGGTEAGRYPMTIYNSWFRHFFTFIVPLACVSYYPVLTILQRPEASPWAGWMSPFMSIAFLVLSLGFWNFGVSCYRSTGS